MSKILKEAFCPGAEKENIMTKYTKLEKYPNIFSYETKKGKRYRIRRGFFDDQGKKGEIDESGFKTIPQAKVRLAEIELMLDKREIGYFTKKNITCDEYYSDFSMRRVKTKIWSPDTKRSNDMNWRNHISPTFGHIPLSKLNRATYELWVANQLEDFARSSVLSYHETFMNMLNDAVTLGFLERNRLQRVYIGESAKSPRSKYFSFESYKNWMRAAEKYLSAYDFAFVYLSVFGLRRGEIMGVRSSSFHFHRGLHAKIHIFDTRTNEMPNGKGSTKTGKPRWQSLDDRGERLIKAAIKESIEIKADHGEILHKDDFLYLNPRTGKPYDVGQLNRLFKQINDITGLHAYPHLLRHYFTSQAVVAGVPKEQAAAVLGHTTIHMTEKYTHIQDEVSGKVIDLVADRLDYTKKEG